MKTRHENGFTIVELMIATVVFSVILLMTLGGFLQIGRTFYKGMTISRTENTIRNVADSLSSDIRSSSVAVATATATTPGPDGNPVSYFCIGQHVYYFRAGVIFDNDSSSLNNPKSSYGLKQDNIGECTGNALRTLITTPTPNAKELLGEKMRVSKLSVICSSASLNRLCEISIHIAYGDDDLLGPPASDPNALCKGATTGTQFCATADINTSILRGGSI